METKPKLKIGITGQAGFIGTHLYNHLGLIEDKFIRVPFEDEYFENPDILESFARNCDVIIHLAAMNRHEDAKFIYDTNIKLTQKLIEACLRTSSKPYIVFSSSTQESLDNLYGQSKKKCKEMLIEWATQENASFTTLTIPNVFGPFGKPYYNSVVATFCHQLTNDQTPKIKIDKTMDLIYVNDLTKIIIEIISNPKSDINKIRVPHGGSYKVSVILNMLNEINDSYCKNGIVPDLSNTFGRQLFNTFITYLDYEKFYPSKLKMNTDERGSFIELLKSGGGGQVSFSTTKPGITRGNHFHTRKAERFAVIKGKAQINIRKIGSNKVIKFNLSDKQPSFVDMPVWFTHNIVNTGHEDLYTVFWINEPYDISDPDTYYETV